MRPKQSADRLTRWALWPAGGHPLPRRLLAGIQAVYHTIGRPVPSALPAYLEKEEHCLAHEPYGIVSLFTTSRYGFQSKPTEQILWFRLGRNR